MKLIEISIENFKSYFDRQAVAVGPGFNIFLGGNNAGKTTMLEALDADYHANIPHRSLKNLTNFGSQPSGVSAMSVKMQTDVYEMQNPSNRSLTLLIGDNWRNELGGQDIQGNAVRRLCDRPEVTLTYGFGASLRQLTSVSSLGTSQSSPDKPVLTFTADVLDGKGLIFKSLQNDLGWGAETHQMLGRLLGQFYRFSAHRRPPGQCGETNHPVVLAPDASNLPYCLNYLQSNDPHGYEQLCEWITRIFPAVHWVQASPRPGNLFEIECLPLPRSTRRYDLSIPLAKMGSGIGNVIAMLYIVLTARFPRVIAIDEPNSFLHPKALRELLQIFSIEGKAHQYLLTAHSADVLTAVPPSMVTLFDVPGGATVSRQVRGTELTSIREELSTMGIRMTDLHGRDRVLWVEGQTEESVIPLLLQRFCIESAAGTAVLRVEHTGTFEKKGVAPKEVAALYSRLTSSSALVPPMVGILLDRERRTKAECERLTDESSGVLKFLPEPMLENYVLHPGAISHALNEHGEAVGLEAVQSYLTELVDAHTSGHVDGAKILTKVFDKFTEARTEFKKTHDVAVMITWLLEEDIEHLRPLGKFLQDLFPRPS